jgi:hypothetical protein
MSGDLHDTYVAALQHDIVDLPDDIHLLGVVRKPTPWFYGAVDDNERALGPPTDLLEDLSDHQEELAAQGMCEEGAHNAAWEEFDFDVKYRAYLETEEAEAAIDDVLARLDAGENLALVCYENTERKRCHRTILRDVLESRMA